MSMSGSVVVVVLALVVLRSKCRELGVLRVLDGGGEKKGNKELDNALLSYLCHPVDAGTNTTHRV